MEGLKLETWEIDRFKSRVEKLKRISKLESKSEENFSQYLAE